jgi:hypothetical protein
LRVASCFLQAATAEVNGLGVRDETTSSDPILLLCTTAEMNRSAVLTTG